MSWDLVLWRGATVDSRYLWKRICDGESMALRPIALHELERAVARAFDDGTFRVLDGEIMGRGWSMEVSADKLVQAQCQWDFAVDGEFLRRMLRVAQNLGASLFDPQLGAFWPEGEVAEHADPWSASVFDSSPGDDDDDDKDGDDPSNAPAPTADDEDHDTSLDDYEDGTTGPPIIFSDRVLPDRVDPSTGCVIHALRFTKTPDPVRVARLLVARLTRCRAAGRSRQQVQLDRGHIPPDVFDELATAAANSLGVEIVPRVAGTPTGVVLELQGELGLRTAAELSHRLRRITIHPQPLKNAEETTLARIFGDLTLFVWIRRHDLDVARAEVLAELRALWDALARRPASAPRIVRLDTGMSLSPDTLSERDLD